MNITLACGCRFLRGSVLCSVFPCDAHQEGNLIRALLDELDRDITDLQKERERLREQLDEYSDQVVYAAQEIDRLESKLGRYRTALERIIETWDGDSESMHDDPAEIAREALSDE